MSADLGPHMRHRSIEVRLNRALRSRDTANRKVARYAGKLRQLSQEAAERFGLTPDQMSRLTPDVLDTLDRVEADGDCWIWTGARNAKGLPRIRDTRTHPYVERSACVLLDMMLNDSDGSGIRYPNCRSGTDCVNPAHKKTRGAGRKFSGVGAFKGGDAWRDEQEAS